MLDGKSWFKKATEEIETGEIYYLQVLEEICGIP